MRPLTPVEQAQRPALLRRRLKLEKWVICLSIAIALVSAMTILMWYAERAPSLPQHLYGYGGIYEVFQVPIAIVSVMAAPTRPYEFHYLAVVFRLMGTLTFFWTTYCVLSGGVSLDTFEAMTALAITQIGNLGLSYVALVAQGALAHHRAYYWWA